MDPIVVLYAQCGLAETVFLLNEASSEKNFGLWSLQGDPSTLHIAPSAIAMRVSIFTEKVQTPHDPPMDQIVGSAHVIKVTPEKTRICFRRDDVVGEPLPDEAEEGLLEFSDYFGQVLEEENLRLTDEETGGRTVLLNQLADTGPLAS
jgi:hypothetical protein